MTAWSSHREPQQREESEIITATASVSLSVRMCIYPPPVSMTQGNLAVIIQTPTHAHDQSAAVWTEANTDKSASSLQISLFFNSHTDTAVNQLPLYIHSLLNTQTLWPSPLTCPLCHHEIRAALLHRHPRSPLTMSIWPTGPETTRTSLRSVES